MSVFLLFLLKPRHFRFTIDQRLKYDKFYLLKNLSPPKDNFSGLQTKKPTCNKVGFFYA